MKSGNSMKKVKINNKTLIVVLIVCSFLYQLLDLLFLVICPDYDLSTEYIIRFVLLVVYSAIFMIYIIFLTEYKWSSFLLLALILLTALNFFAFGEGNVYIEWGLFTDVGVLWWWLESGYVEWWSAVKWILFAIVMLCACLGVYSTLEGYNNKKIAYISFSVLLFFSSYNCLFLIIAMLLFAASNTIDSYIVTPANSLKVIQRRFEKGVITQEEYEKQRQQIIDRL